MASCMSTGHRIADVIGFGANAGHGGGNAYANIRRIRGLGSYYRDGHRPKPLAAGQSELHGYFSF